MTTIEKAESRKDLWLVLSQRWKYTYWVVGTLAVLVAALAAMPDNAIQGVKIPSKLFSALSAFVVGFIGFADPLKQSNRLMRAYKIIDNGINLYEIQKDEEKLIACIASAEEAANPT